MCYYIACDCYYLYRYETQVGSRLEDKSYASKCGMSRWNPLSVHHRTFSLDYLDITQRRLWRYLFVNVFRFLRRTAQTPFIRLNRLLPSRGALCWGDGGMATAHIAIRRNPSKIKYPHQKGCLKGSIYPSHANNMLSKLQVISRETYKPRDGRVHELQRYLRRALEVFQSMTCYEGLVSPENNSRHAVAAVNVRPRVYCKF